MNQKQALIRFLKDSNLYADFKVRIKKIIKSNEMETYFYTNTLGLYRIYIYALCSKNKNKISMIDAFERQMLNGLDKQKIMNDFIKLLTQYPTAFKKIIFDKGFDIETFKTAINHYVPSRFTSSAVMWGVPVDVCSLIIREWDLYLRKLYYKHD